MTGALIYLAETSSGVIELHGFTSPESARREAMNNLGPDERLLGVRRACEQWGARL